MKGPAARRIRKLLSALQGAVGSGRRRACPAPRPFGAVAGFEIAGVVGGAVARLPLASVLQGRHRNAYASRACPAITVCRKCPRLFACSPNIAVTP